MLPGKESAFLAKSRDLLASEATGDPDAGDDAAPTRFFGWPEPLSSGWCRRGKVLAADRAPAADELDEEDAWLVFGVLRNPVSLLCERPCDTLVKASGGARETLPPPRPRFPARDTLPPPRPRFPLSMLPTLNSHPDGRERFFFLLFAGTEGWSHFLKDV